MTAHCLALQRPGWLPPHAKPPTTAAAARRSAAAWRPWHRAAAAAQAARRRQPSGGGSSEDSDGNAGPTSSAEQQQQLGNSSAEQQVLDNMSSAPRAAETDPAAIAAARQRLAAYLQQQDGISRGQAAQLAGELSARLGAAADQLVPALQWLIERRMRPVKAAQLVVRICSGSSSHHAAFIRPWSTWQPVWEANWQLVDSYLAAYQQECCATKQTPLKSSQSVVVLLSGQPSRYRSMVVPGLPSRLALLQQQLGLTAAQLGELFVSGMHLGGSQATIAAAMRWLVSFAGSKEAAAAMLRAAPNLVSSRAATLDSKVAALEAAWTGVLQPSEVRQLVQRTAMVLTGCKADQYAPTTAVLSSWFPQPVQLLAVLQGAPILLAAPAASLLANERWLTGPPLNLSRNEFLQLVAARPKPFLGNLAGSLTQHKLAFLTQVGGVPLERALSTTHIEYIQRSTTALAGRYFLLTEHGVPLHRHADGGIMLGYAAVGLRALLNRMRPHDSAGRLPADDDAAVEYLRQWLAAWPESESGQLWAQPPPASIEG